MCARTCGPRGDRAAMEAGSLPSSRLGVGVADAAPLPAICGRRGVNTPRVCAGVCVGVCVSAGTADAVCEDRRGVRLGAPVGSGAGRGLASYITMLWGVPGEKSTEWGMGAASASG